MQDGIIFGKIFAGLLCLLVSFIGLMLVINPKLMTTFQVQANKTKIKIRITPGIMFVYRAMGIVFFVLGILMFLIATTTRW